MQRMQAPLRCPAVVAAGGGRSPRPHSGARVRSVGVGSTTKKAIEGEKILNYASATIDVSATGAPACYREAAALERRANATG